MGLTSAAPAWARPRARWQRAGYARVTPVDPPRLLPGSGAPPGPALPPRLPLVAAVPIGYALPCGSRARREAERVSNGARQEAERSAMKKPIALTLLLAGLPVPLLIPGVVRIVGGAGVYRLIVLWGLPVAAALVAAAFTIGRRRGFLFGGSPATLRRLAPWSALALAAANSFLGIGHAFGFITFTYGDQGLSGHPFRAMAWGLPLCLALGAFGWEWTLRRTLYLSWIGHVARPAALLISCAVGVALAAPSITPGLEIPDTAYVAAAFLVVACRE